MKRALLVLVLLGCDTGDKYTIGEYCDDIGASFCARVEQCGVDSFNACFQPFKFACCVDAGKCDGSANGFQDRVERCSRALPTHRCDDIRRGVLPAACLTSD